MMWYDETDEPMRISDYDDLVRGVVPPNKQGQNTGSVGNTGNAGNIGNVGNVGNAGNAGNTGNDYGDEPAATPCNCRACRESTPHVPVAEFPQLGPRPRAAWCVLALALVAGAAAFLAHMTYKLLDAAMGNGSAVLPVFARFALAALVVAGIAAALSDTTMFDAIKVFYVPHMS